MLVSTAVSLEVFEEADPEGQAQSPYLPAHACLSGLSEARPPRGCGSPVRRKLRLRSEPPFHSQNGTISRYGVGKDGLICDPLIGVLCLQGGHYLVPEFPKPHHR